MERIGAETTVAGLIREYPEMMDWLVAYNPKFEALRNPVLRNTIGRVATLRQAAVIAGVEVDRLVEDIRLKLGQAESDGGPSDREALKAILKDLHGGAAVEEVQARFNRLATRLDGAQIARLEQELVQEGMPIQEIQRLCDVHARLLGGGGSDPHAAVHGHRANAVRASDTGDSQAQGQGVDAPQAPQGATPGGQPGPDGHHQVQERPELSPGHPGHTLIAENEVLEADAMRLEELVVSLDVSAGAKGFLELRAQLEEGLKRLLRVDIHYTRKENQFFPFLERHGITAPPQVMWAVHDEIRAKLKKTHEALAAGDAGAFRAELAGAIHSIREMIFKEERIFLPLCLAQFSIEEWGHIRRGEGEIGYILDAPVPNWGPGAEGQAGGGPGDGAGSGSTPAGVPGSGSAVGMDLLQLRNGSLSLPQLTLMLTHLPVDITFVDENDEVRFYSDTKERVFPRSPGVIGRKVQNCHPPKSLHVVNEILGAFRRGEKDVAEFWIELGGRFLYIRYLAVRDPLGKYRGCLEVMQDATRIRGLQGQRRLLQWGEEHNG